MANPPMFYTNQSPVDIARTLDRDGFVCLGNVISDEWLKLARDEVRTMADRCSQSIFATGVGDNDDIFAAFVHDPSVQRLVRELVEIAWPSQKWDSKKDSQRRRAHHRQILAFLNVTRGPGYHLHYDAYVLALLIPLVRPTYAGCGRSGELAVFPNRRPFRRSVIVNLIEKVAVQNFLSNRRNMRRLRRGGSNIKPLEVSNAYLFWGYRTLHGVMPTPPGDLRATLLIQAGQPHGDHWTLGLVNWIRTRLDDSRGYRRYENLSHQGPA